MKIKIAARQSDLARLQAFEVGRALEKASRPDQKLEIEYAFRSSLGDQRADDPLWKMPEKGVFTEDFVADILSGQVDMVVHSWKDLPIVDRDGTRIVATLDRADARDVLLVRRDRWRTFWQNRKSSAPGVFKILTSSPRRVYNLEPFLRWALPWPLQASGNVPQIEFVPVRGNIATRVGKLTLPAMDESFDALVVAKAALDRLLTSGKYGETFIESAASLRRALGGVDFVVLPLSVNPAAAAQGALAIEVRSDRQDLIDLCAKIDASNDRECVETERRELARHGGGCHQKIGVTILRRAYGTIEFVRGLTDGGLVLNTMKLIPSKPLTWPKPNSEAEIWGLNPESALRSQRDPVSHPELKKMKSASGHVRGYFVARAEAWPQAEPSPSDSYIWTAGLATWRKLCERGIWVHGSTEGLGEDDDTRLEILAGQAVDWLRLTHEGADHESISRVSRSLATYRVEVEVPAREKLLNCRYFYWRSGSQFRAALKACPEIASSKDMYHATGPGHTHVAVQASLRESGLQDAEIERRMAIFLNEAEFLAALKNV